MREYFNINGSRFMLRKIRQGDSGGTGVLHAGGLVW
jgi:hypothetical protein